MSRTLESRASDLGAVVMVNHETKVYPTKCPSLAAILHGMFSRVCRRSDGV